MSVDDSSHDLTAGSLRPGQNIDDLLGQIKVACPSCIETSREDAERLQEFCDLAIRELSEFLEHVAHVKLYSPGDGPEHLDRALHVVLDYMKDKLPLIVAERQLRAFFNLRSPQQQHHHHHRVPAACDIRKSVRDAVQLHINAVVDAAEVSNALARGCAYAQTSAFTRITRTCTKQLRPGGHEKNNKYMRLGFHEQ